MENEIIQFIVHYKLFSNNDDQIIMSDWEKVLAFICTRRPWIKNADFLITFSSFYLQSLNDNKKWWGKIEPESTFVLEDSPETQTYLIENNIKVQDIKDFYSDLQLICSKNKALYSHYEYIKP